MDTEGPLLAFSSCLWASWRHLTDHCGKPGGPSFWSNEAPILTWGNSKFHRKCSGPDYLSSHLHQNELLLTFETHWEDPAPASTSSLQTATCWNLTSLIQAKSSLSSCKDPEEGYFCSCSVSVKSVASWGTVKSQLSTMALVNSLKPVLYPLRKSRRSHLLADNNGKDLSCWTLWQ